MHALSAWCCRLETTSFFSLSVNFPFSIFVFVLYETYFHCFNVQELCYDYVCKSVNSVQHSVSAIVSGCLKIRDLEILITLLISHGFSFSISPIDQQTKVPD